MESELISQF
jgi:hypothetical protein